MGGLERPPNPPTFVASRRSRDAPLTPPRRSERPGEAVTVLSSSALGATRETRAAPFFGEDFTSWPAPWCCRSASCSRSSSARTSCASSSRSTWPAGCRRRGSRSGCRWCLARCRCWTRPTATRVDAHAAVPATRRARAGGTARARAACGSATRRTAQDRDAQERQRRLHHVRKGRGSVRWPKRRGIMIRF